MRSFKSYSLATALALASMAAAGCGSKDSKSASKTEVSAEGGEHAASSETAEATRERPSLPTPRRMRGAEPSTPDGEEMDDASRQEWRERQRERFAETRKKFDTDGDGELNDTERTEMQRARIKDRIATADTNSDGKLTREEAEASPRGGRMYRNFDAMDVDGDKMLSPEEIEAAMSERRERRFERRRREGTEGSGGEGQISEPSTDQ